MREAICTNKTILHTIWKVVYWSSEMKPYTICQWLSQVQF
jgi:hypothetical protein